jgi:alpha-galactosidase
VINYAIPMAMATWYLDALDAWTVVLCHSVQGTLQMLARELDVPYDEVRFRAGGINHQSWFVEFRRGDEDLYPRLREVMTQRHLHGPRQENFAADHGDHSGADRGAAVYEGGNERVRTTIMEAFGYFHTESSHHASEYLPYFRRTPALVCEFIPERWVYYEICQAHDEDGQIARLLDELKRELAPSVEYGAVKYQVWM